MLFLQDITYTHPNKDLLFAELNLVVNQHDKIALTGNNGAGKSTLLNILAGKLNPSKGLVKADAQLYHVPQLSGQMNEQTVARALGIEEQLRSLSEILGGHVTAENLALLNDDWGIEERCREAFAHWKLEGIEPDQKMGTLSGGQKTSVLLAGIDIHRPEIVLMDEPSNHLDAGGRSRLYDYITATRHTLVVVSHDRTLLNLLHTVYELSKGRITVYGGNYAFYAEQKMIESDALDRDLKNREKALRKAKETEKEALERRQKLDARGKKKQEKAGLPTISMNTLRNNAEKSTSRMKDVHSEKTGMLSEELSKLRATLSGTDEMKLNFDHSTLHTGKILITVAAVNVGYDHRFVWEKGLSFQIRSGERVAVKGPNGSGKTTLIKLLLGELSPQAGTIDNACVSPVYLDQDYSLINHELSVYQQAQRFNSGILQEHEIKVRLNRFLFTHDYWDKPCRSLSGGEKMRLMLCALTIGNQAPDLIILDEPTNNLDLHNIAMLTSAINNYRGTLIVISHDAYFLEEIGVERAIVLE